MVAHQLCDGSSLDPPRSSATGLNLIQPGEKKLTGIINTRARIAGLRPLTIEGSNALTAEASPQRRLVSLLTPLALSLGEGR